MNYQRTHGNLQVQLFTLLPISNQYSIGNSFFASTASWANVQMNTDNEENQIAYLLKNQLLFR